MNGPAARPRSRSTRTGAARIASLALALAAVGVPHANALILDAGDGHGNTEPPSALSGWANVGRRLGGPSVIYVGNRWVLTARHVGAGVVLLGDERYDPEAWTVTPVTNDDGSDADLLLFRLDRDPGLPTLPIARTPPRIGEDVVLVGMGSSRGAPLTVRSPRQGLLDGWWWVPDGTKRWGTNLVSGAVQRVGHDDAYTLAIPTIFDRIDDPLGTRQEATAAEGDSGGALFARENPLLPDSRYVLTGVLFSVSNLPEQPPATSLYGSATYSADLSSYRAQLLAVTRPACSNERDDDGDGRVDHPADEGCRSASDDDEGAGLGGASAAPWALGAIAAALLWRGHALWRARHSGVT